jgi:hypothetical protein
MLAPIVDEAIWRWTEALSLDDAAVAALYAVDFEIADFSDLTLGMAGEDTIFIDADAAGWGWFVDTTPADDSEFGSQLSEFDLLALEISPAFGEMGLLTTVMHEFGHILGFENLDPDSGYLMSETLEAGERHLPGGQSLVVMDMSEIEEEKSLESPPADMRADGESLAPGLPDRWEEKRQFFWPLPTIRLPPEREACISSSWRETQTPRRRRHQHLHRSCGSFFHRAVGVIGL